jgi:transcriptional regulator with XRE-family HTH domain
MGQYAMTFADHLKRVREQAGFTQEDLAERLGYPSQSRIGNYESGAREPKAREIARIADALKVTVGELFGESRSLRLDADMVAMAYKAVCDLVDDKQRAVYDITADPASFVQMYELRTAINAPKGATGDGQNHVGPAESAGTKEVAGKVQRKAKADAGEHKLPESGNARSKRTKAR